MKTYREFTETLLEGIQEISKKEFDGIMAKHQANVDNHWKSLTPGQQRRIQKPSIKKYFAKNQTQFMTASNIHAIHDAPTIMHREHPDGSSTYHKFTKSKSS